MNDIKTQIQSTLNAFSKGNLSQNAKALLNILGYESERTIQLSPNNYKGFSELFQTGPSSFDTKRAKIEDWQSIDIIFQLTEDDIKKSYSLFEAKKVDNTIIESYLFFALSLTGEKYTRGDLVRITREINRLTPMPAMVLFRYNDFLTIAVIDRRLHKRESSKDVLAKVTLIKDINLTQPHRAHMEILHDLSFQNLVTKYSVSNFIALHNVWRKTLDTSELNKKFFRELANWYFWALRNVEFPDDAEKNRDVRNATSVIRMITRLIFIWFVKEKGLIPDELFNQAKLRNLLNFSDKNQSTYYKAILQNLFFATLNTEMNKDRPGSRKFRGKRQEGRDQHYMIHNVFRYEDYFTNPQDTLKKYFENIPFLNGGLFECLDKDVSPTLAKGGEGGFSNKKVMRIDSFSDRADNPLKVPDELFFSEEKGVDLNEIYGTKNKTYKVRGLINILDSYKFTVDENTPIEEEIALDPELLGKVFENLLASYNPETQTTARKQTGSFYTPREIVNYMVDESIIAYLTTALDRHSREGGNPENPPSSPFFKVGDNNPTLAKGGKGGFEESFESRLRHLVAYNDDPHRFTPTEVDALIAAINTLKALDPACGSGAFPMGMLHKLVYILGKLDPDNSKWRELQRQKAIKETEEAYKNEDKEDREKRLLDISEVFENNASDYGRKLYLIENCIFGVDIQPIAVQIAKLRFFVSLIVDQRIDPKKENLGVRPLPNLETKFVAANTLIGIEKPAQMMFRNPDIDRKEKELKKVRERHFTARTPQTKEKYRKADESLRAEISELLKNDGFPRETTEKLAKWNPYDQNASAGFFDPEWMFGITDGYDITIGNPPYVSALDFAKIYGDALRENLNAHYESATGTYDLFILFVEQGLKLCKSLGHLTYITPNKYLAAKYASGLRSWLLDNASLLRLLDVSPIRVFEEAAVYPVVSIFRKEPQSARSVLVSLPVTRSLERFDSEYYEDSFVPSEWLRILPENIWGFLLSRNASLLPTVTRSATPLIKLGEVNATSTAGEADEFGAYLALSRGTDGMKVINTGTIEKYVTLWGTTEMTHKGKKFLTPYLPLAKVNSRRVAMYKAPKVLFAKMAKTCEATIDASGEFASLNTNCFYSPQRGISLKYIGGVCNSQMFMFLYDLFFGALRMSGGYYQFQAPQLRVVPVPQADMLQQKAVEALVDQILTAKKKDPNADTSALEKKIDEMVYALYGLTPEEIAIVEGNNEK